MEVMTFNIDKDRRNLTDDTQNFDIDFSDSKYSWLAARQYENQMRQVQLNLQHGDGEPLDLTGANIVFEGLLPDGEHRIIDAKHSVVLDAVNGQARFDFPAPAFAVSGSYKQAFFRVYRNGLNVASLEFSLEVYADKVISGLIAADYITPFNDAYDELKLIITGAKGDLDTALSTWTTKLSGLFTDLQGKGVTTQTMLTTLEAKITADGLLTVADFDQKVKDNELVTGSELGTTADFYPTATTLIEKIKAALDDYGINVVNYGAVGDGVTDNKTAINTALQAAKDTGANRIYFPAGKFYTSGTNVLIDHMTVSGADRFASVIISDKADAVFDVKTNSCIDHLGFEDTSGTTATMLKVCNSDTVASYFSIRFVNLHIFGQEKKDGTAGLWGLTGILFDLNNKGLWDVTIDDVQCEWVKSGLTIDTYNNGWFTGSYVNNLLVKGYAHAAFEIISNNNTMRQISQCAFTNCTAEILYTVPDAVGFIVSGTGNDFNNLRLFGDGTWSGKALCLKSYADPDKVNDVHRPSFGYGSAANNSFVGGTIEGTIDDPDGIRELQHFDNLRLQIKDSDGNTQQVNVNDPIHSNLISRAVLMASLDPKSQNIGSPAASLTAGADQYGNYVEISTGDKGGIWQCYLTDVDKTVSALRGNNYSIGVRFQTISGSKNISSKLHLNETDYSTDNLVYQYKNPNIQSVMQESSWVFNSSADYFTAIAGQNHRFDSVIVYIGANSDIRIYDIYLTSGEAINFNRINNDDALNLPINAGGRNYIQNSNDMLSVATPVANQAPLTKAFQVDVSDLNWLINRYFTLSIDINIDNYVATSTSSTSRLAAWLSLDLVFEDNTTMSLSTGALNADTALIRDRYSTFFHMPNKRISKAVCQIATVTGFTADYFQIGRPQLETGTVAHDFVPYVAVS